VGVGLSAGDAGIIIRCVLGLLFLVLTSPVSAHLLARAALKTGIEPVSTTSIDD